MPPPLAPTYHPPKKSAAPSPIAADVQFTNPNVSNLNGSKNTTLEEKFYNLEGKTNLFHLLDEDAKDGGAGADCDLHLVRRVQDLKYTRQWK